MDYNNATLYATAFKCILNCILLLNCILHVQEFAMNRIVMDRN